MERFFTSCFLEKSEKYKGKTVLLIKCLTSQIMTNNFEYIEKYHL